jgi:WD40 repeat protein
VAFSPDGRLLVAGGFDGVRVWDTATWAPRAAFQAFPGIIHDLAFSPDGRTLVTAGGLPVIKCWNTATWRMTLALEAGQGSVRSAQFTADGNALITSSDDGTVRIWRAGPAAEEGRP